MELANLGHRGLVDVTEWLGQVGSRIECWEGNTLLSIGARFTIGHVVRELNNVVLLCP